MPKVNPVSQVISNLSAIMMDLREIELTASSGSSVLVTVDQELRIAMFDVARKHIIKSIKRFHVKPVTAVVDDQIDFIEPDSELHVDAYSLGKSSLAEASVTDGQLSISTARKRK